MLPGFAREGSCWVLRFRASSLGSFYGFLVCKTRCLEAHVSVIIVCGLQVKRM